MITMPQITVDGETAQVVAYLNAHQRAEADPAALIRMNASYGCDVHLVDGEWRISRLVLSVGWFDNGQPS